MGTPWQPLRPLRERFEANLEAMRSRLPALAAQIQAVEPSAQYVFSADPSRVLLGKQIGERVEPINPQVSPVSAREIVNKVYPSGKCTEPLMVAGLDQGWLWTSLYEMESHTPMTPGHRPPLYLLARDLERLWLVMYVQDWTKLLKDGRVRLFAGADAVDQCRRDMMNHTHIPWAKLCVTVDPTIWPRGASVDSLWQAAHQTANTRFQQLNRQVEAIYTGVEPKRLASRLRGEKLRILGITSLYTTFLKYSMSDWLDAMESLGHDVRLVMEQSDHEITNPIYFAQEVIDFKPDAILMIDHYRAEMAGLPKPIPCVMWVQDNLPNIFSPKAGAAQGPRDYCVGFGRLHLRDQCGYPEQRFMPAHVGVNDQRFAPRELTQAEQDFYGCDASFVSHASAPATALLTEQLNRTDATGKKLLIEVFEQIRAIYDRGDALMQPRLMPPMLDASLAHYKLQLDEPSRRTVLDFFTHRVNNALFRHQSVSWLADMDINLHLYGRGWEQHPRFAKYAKGIADNQTQLAKIYQASKINLQVTPFGAVHQRLLDGLAAGGFFLIRYTPGDVVEVLYRQIWEWCQQHDVQDDTALTERATPEIVQLLGRIKTILGVGPFDLADSFIDVLRLSADGQYIRGAKSIWPNQYDDVSFNSAQQLQQRVTHFLASPTDRRQIAQSMREPVIERFSYRRISSRLLEFIADDVAKDSFRQGVAA